MPRGSEGAAVRRLLAVAALCLLSGTIGCSEYAEPVQEESTTSAPAAPQGGKLSPMPTLVNSHRHRVVLESEGLAVEGSGATRQSVSFGDPATTASAAVGAVYGSPTRVETLEECGAGRLEITAFGGLSLAAQDDKFVGWAVDARGRQPLPTSEAGIGVGSTRRSIEKAYRVVGFDSSLGYEFTANGFAGLLNGEGETARITHLWAGATCIMR